MSLFRGILVGVSVLWGGSVASAVVCYMYTSSCTRSESSGCGTITVCRNGVTDILPDWACGWTTISSNEASWPCLTYQGAISLSCAGPHSGFRRIDGCALSYGQCCWVPEEASPTVENNAGSSYVLTGNRCGNCPGGGGYGE